MPAQFFTGALTRAPCIATSVHENRGGPTNGQSSMFTRICSEANRQRAPYEKYEESSLPDRVASDWPHALDLRQSPVESNCNFFANSFLKTKGLWGTFPANAATSCSFF